MKRVESKRSMRTSDTSRMSIPIDVIIFPGFQLLDAAGPIGAFTAANRFAPDAYAVSVLALKPGPVASHSGAVMHAARP